MLWFLLYVCEAFILVFIVSVDAFLTRACPSGMVQVIVCTPEKWDIITRKSQVRARFGHLCVSESKRKCDKGVVGCPRERESFPCV